MDGRAGLVLAVPLVDGLHIVGPRVTGCHSEDHQLVLQRDGSVSERGQRQSQAKEPLVCTTTNLLRRLEPPGVHSQTRGQRASCQWQSADPFRSVPAIAG